MNVQVFKDIAAYLKSYFRIAESSNDVLPKKIDTRQHVTYIECPDCGRQVAFRDRCPVCGGEEWLHVSETEGYDLKKKLRQSVVSSRAEEDRLK